jgi:DNA-binding Lrp family transcriptional regulator
MKLDEIDHNILETLQRDARLSNKELAATVGLAPSSCLERVRRLKQNGVLQGFHATVNPKELNIGLEAMIAVQLQRHSRNMVETFHNHIMGLPEVTAIYHVAGTHDYLVHVSVKDSDHLRDLALDAFTTRDEVAHIQTSLIFGSERKAVLPNYLD